VPPAYTYGTTARSAFWGPARHGFDFSLMKNFHVTEAKYFQFRADAFNLPNFVNLATPGGGASPGYVNLGGTGTTAKISPQFMQITAAGPARTIQLSMKFVF